jgi:hypothetical protein
MTLRPDLSLFIGILGIVVLAALLSGCADRRPGDLIGGLGFDMLGAAIGAAAGGL